LHEVRKANKGSDLDCAYFTNRSFKYVIFITSSAMDNKYEIGLKVIDMKIEKVTIIKGIVKTKQGTLIDFRENDLLEIGVGLFG
jgi:hypothetical protein